MKDSTKKFLKDTLIFVAGAVVGGLVAYEIARRKYETEYLDEQRFDDEEKIKELINYEQVEENKNTMDDKKGKVLFIPRDVYKNKVKNLGYDRKENDVDPAELESPPEDISDDEKEDYNKYERMSVGCNEESSDEPHIITLEEYSEEMLYYDKLSLNFYEDDEVLTDESEEIIDDPIAILGEDALYSFGIGSEDPEVVYVRNDNLQIDYEIIRLSKSYKETVLGDVEGSGDND